jgi:preprotein translocase subunit YajC
MKVRKGDSVKLLNGFKETINEIDAHKGKFNINGEYNYMSFIIADIIELNGVDVRYNTNLTF